MSAIIEFVRTTFVNGKRLAVWISVLMGRRPRPPCGPMLRRTTALTMRTLPSSSRGRC